MRPRNILTVLTMLISALLLWLPGLPATADDVTTDWPQMRGQDRSGISLERGLKASWPTEGPTINWRIPLGGGFSGVTVVGGQIYTTFADGEQEVLAAFRAADGRELWRATLDEALETPFGNGPRSTPAADGDEVFALGSNGKLVAARRQDGEVLWTLDLPERFGSRTPRWGFSNSPLVDGEVVILEAGGTENNGFVALDRKTGEVRWAALDERGSYSSPIVMHVDGVKQYVFLSSSNPNITSILPDGTIHWTYEWFPGGIAMPVAVGEDGIFVSASNDTGGTLLRVSKGKEPTVEQVWHTREMKNHFNSSVALDGHIYGFDNANLKCLDAATGERKWVKRGLGKGSLIAADGLLIILSDTGRLVLAKATPEGYQETASAQILEGRSWTAPSLAGGNLYLRNHDEMVSVRLKS